MTVAGQLYHLCVCDCSGTVVSSVFVTVAGQLYHLCVCDCSGTAASSVCL